MPSLSQFCNIYNFFKIYFFNVNVVPKCSQKNLIVAPLIAGSNTSLHQTELMHYTPETLHRIPMEITTQKSIYPNTLWQTWLDVGE